MAYVDSDRPKGGFWRNLVPNLIFGSMNPEIGRFYRTDLPSDHDIVGRTGVDALAHQLKRNAARANYAMENVSYWSLTAANLAVGAVGLVGAGAQAARPAAAVGKVAQFVGEEITNTARTVAPTLEHASENQAAGVARNLLKLRDEAVRISDKLAGQLVKDGAEAMSPAARGEFVDAVLKGLARDAIDRGVLPPTLRIAPAPSSITGGRPPAVPTVDFWLPNGDAFDLMTSTVRSVAGHDLRYIGRTMLDGTVIRDVFPLVYPSLRARSSSSLLSWLRGATRVSGAVGLGAAAATASQNAFADTQRRMTQRANDIAAQASRRNFERSQQAFQDFNRRSMERYFAAQQDALRKLQQSSTRPTWPGNPTNPGMISRPGGSFGAPYGIDPFRGAFRTTNPISAGPQWVPSRIITHDLDRTMSGAIIPGPFRGTEFVRIPGHYR